MLSKTSTYRLKAMTKKFFQDETAATAVEYGLIVALIACVIIGAVKVLGTSLSAMFTGIKNDVAGASPT